MEFRNNNNCNSSIVFYYCVLQVSNATWIIVVVNTVQAHYSVNTVCAHTAMMITINAAIPESSMIYVNSCWNVGFWEIYNTNVFTVFNTDILHFKIT